MHPIFSPTVSSVLSIGFTAFSLLLNMGLSVVLKFCVREL